MAEITKMPTDLPSTDVLKSIPDDLFGPQSRELRLGANVLLVLDEPPKLGETRDVVIRLRVAREGAEQKAVDGDTTYFCGGKIVTAWLLGQPVPPHVDEDQPALLNEDGEIPEDEDDDEPGIERPVDRPGFSNAEEN